MKRILCLSLFWCGALMSMADTTPVLMADFPAPQPAVTVDPFASMSGKLDRVEFLCDMFDNVLFVNHKSIIGEHILKLYFNEDVESLHMTYKNACLLCALHLVNLLASLRDEQVCMTFVQNDEVFGLWSRTLIRVLERLSEYVPEVRELMPGLCESCRADACTRYNVCRSCVELMKNVAGPHVHLPQGIKRGTYRDDYCCRVITNKIMHVFEEMAPLFGKSVSQSAPDSSETK